MSSIESRRYAAIVWKRCALAAGLILLVAMAFAAKQSDEQAKPSTESSQKTSFEGSWKLNHDQSEDARDQLRSAVQDRQQNGPMQRHGGGMGGGGIGMGIPGIGGMGRPGGSGGGMGRGDSSSDENRARLRET